MAALAERDQKKVCKICFNSSSHKPVPFLTPESKSRVDPGTKKKYCSQCHQEWISVIVCKEPGTWKWVHVRSNLPKNVVMCRYIRRSGTKLCPIGNSCHFAHNRAEVVRFSSLPSSTRAASQSTSSIKSPPRSISSQTSTTLRKRPVLTCQIAEYKLCRYVEAGRRCLHGDFCTFAHGQNELNEWNQDLNNYDSTFTSSISTMDVAVSEEESDNLEYASKVRSDLVARHRQGIKLSGIEETHENVTIKEISGQELSKIGDNQNQYKWTFAVTVTTTQTLRSVVLFDSLSQEFEISSVTHLSTSESSHKEVQVLDKMKVKINQKIEPKEQVHVKIILNAHPGVLNQFVLFEFGSIFRYFIMARGFCVYVPSDLEKQLLLRQKLRIKPELDLHWERHYKEILMETYPFQEESDELLPEYALPENLVGSDNKSQLQGCLTKKNYKERMHCLLFFEEHEHKKIMSRYDLENIIIEPQDSYEDHLKGGMSYAPKNHFFVNLSLEEDLFEGTKSIRSGDDARILISSKNEVHQCIVEHVGRDYIVLLITENTKKACLENNNCCSIRFVPSRLPVRAMHYAIDHINLDTIFPLVSGTFNTAVLNPAAVKKCMKELNKSKLNPLQKEVISTMFKPETTKIPTLVLGPFGVGKTRTLCESIKLITRSFPDTHILVCTHSNSAANLYVKDIHSEWLQRGENDLAPMLRLYFTKRRLESIPDDVKRYCKMENNRLIFPTLAEIKKSRIVVTTLVTSRILFLKGLECGHFSHIIIDEAAQALEPEAIIPLCLADRGTKIVLAGDHLQLVPPLYSSIAKQHDFHITLLERLYDNNAYKSTSESISQCKNLLTMNYRSCQEILEIPSRLFYNTELVSCASFLSNGPKYIQAVQFIGVNGQECRDSYSPSYYNDCEADEVTKQARNLTVGGLKQDDICVLAYDHMQVIQLRRFLRKAKLRSVKVCRVDDVQGEEFRALIVSTVRTCTKEPPPEEDAGFLTDAKLLNTAITRAREWLVVIGEPITLCTVGSNRICWMEFIKYCCRHGTFEYPLANAEKFEVNLENKLVMRNMLGKQYETLMNKLIISCAKAKELSNQDLPITSLNHGEKETANTGKCENDERGARCHDMLKEEPKIETIKQSIGDLTVEVENLNLDRNEVKVDGLHTEIDDVTLQDQANYEKLPKKSTLEIKSHQTGRNERALTPVHEENVLPSSVQFNCITPLHNELPATSQSKVSHAQNTKQTSSIPKSSPLVVPNTSHLVLPRPKQANVLPPVKTRESQTIWSSDSWSVPSMAYIPPVPSWTTATSLVWQPPITSSLALSQRSTGGIPLMNVSPQYGVPPFQSAMSTAVSPQVSSLWQIPNSRSTMQVGALSSQQGQPYQNRFSQVSLMNLNPVEPVQLNTTRLMQPLTLATSYGSGSPTYNVNWPRNDSGAVLRSTSFPRNTSTYLSPMAPTFVPQARPVGSYGNSRSFNSGHHPREPQSYAKRALLPTPMPSYNEQMQSLARFTADLNNVHHKSPGNIQNPGLPDLNIHQNIHRTNMPNPGLSTSTVPQHVYQFNSANVSNMGLSNMDTPRNIHQTNSENVNSPELLLTGRAQQSTDSEEYQKIEDVTVYTECVIGSGAFGTVFKGEFKGSQCAVKVLNYVGTELVMNLPTALASNNSVQEVALEKFKRECEYLQMIDHKNIVRHIVTRTYKKKTAQFPVLVMELLDCNLRNYLLDTTEIKLFVQVSLSADVAAGLEFLHDTKRKIVHRDLCSDNILLATDNIIPVAKISDFGMSRIINFQNLSRSLSALGHRNGYLPPEAILLSSTDVYDSSLDIFMFGAVMTQIAKKISNIQDAKERQQLVLSIESDHPLCDIVVKCLDENRKARPDAGRVRRMLCERLMKYMQ